MSASGSFSAGEIGQTLREARVERGLTTEEIAWRLKVRPELIRTLERRDPTALPQPALVRSHLSSYVRLLGLNEEEILAAFDAEAEYIAPVDELEAQARAERRPPRARWIVAAMISVLALGGASVAGFLGAETDPVPEASSSGDAAAGTLSADEASIRIEMTAKRPARVSITADGVQVFDGTLGVDRPQAFNAREQLGIVAADGGALQLSVNGRIVQTDGPGVFSAKFGPGGRRI